MTNQNNITIINRSSEEIFFGVDTADPTTQKMRGQWGRGSVAPGVALDTVYSGDSGPVKVGLITQPVASGVPYNLSDGIHAILVRGVYPNSVVTISTELGIRVSERGAEG